MFKTVINKYTKKGKRKEKQLQKEKLHLVVVQSIDKNEMKEDLIIVMGVVI